MGRLNFNEAEKVLLKIHGLDAGNFELLAEILSALFPGDRLNEVTREEFMGVVGLMLLKESGHA